jgi:hypothetical protein
MLSEARQTEMLERATTDAQRARMRELFAAGKDAYAEARQGKSVVAAFRRYCETCDPEKIDAGLYHFSTGGAGGLNEIAHFNLHGFRGVYPHPAIYLHRLLLPQADRHGWLEDGVDPNDYHALYVYTDGMTAGDVMLAILKIAAEHDERIVQDYSAKQDAERLAAATALAESIGMRLVPA